MTTRVLSFIACSLWLGSTAQAFELGDPASESLQLHGFVSQGFIKSTDNNFLAKSRRGSFEFTEVGLNATALLGDKLRMGMQLFTRDLGPLGNYRAIFDWFYIDYRFADWLGVRAGRVKLPFGLYNEVNDIDAARVPILLPQSVYPSQSRDSLLAETGGEIYGYLPIGPAGALDYRLYGGTVYVDTARVAAGSPAYVDRVETPYIVGARLFWETPLQGLRVGASAQRLRLDTVLVVGDFTPFIVRIPITMGVASVEYAAHDLLLAVEYSRLRLDARSTQDAIFASVVQDSDRGYAMAAYRVNDWLQPGVYYSLLHPDVDNTKGRAHVQHDAAATLRFDITPNWLVKLEGHYMLGTAALASDINGGKPRSQLERQWGLFLVKTTGYF